jgi:outer membrane protein OmpA-like peptidoglycan-associated protein
MPKFLVPLFCCLSLWVSAQKPAELKRNGDKAFAAARWREAQQLFDQYQAQKPGDTEVLTKLGIAHYQLQQGEKARTLLEYLANRYPDSQDPLLFFYLARTLHGLQEFEKAIGAYKAFLRVAPASHPLRPGIPDQVRRCLSGMAALPDPNVALVENLGAQVNSEGDEFAPLRSPNHDDRLYYSAAREGCAGGRRDDDGYADDAAGHWCSDIFVARLANAGWETQGPLGKGLLNTPRFEVALGFDPSGQVLYFYRGFTLHGGEILADTAARQDEHALEPPRLRSPMQPEEGDGAPFFFDEKTLLFASRRAGGLGGLDLWMSLYADSAWQVPINLGPAINSPYDETTPFLARDGRTLFFSSNRCESIGGLDVFSAFFDDAQGGWQPVQALGPPLNSPADDAFFSLAPDGMTALLASNRLGGNGERDLYAAYFKEANMAQLEASTPRVFAQIGQDKAAADKTPARPQLRLPALSYTNDRDVRSADNDKIIAQAAQAAREHPEPVLLVTAFTDETGPDKFDLYYGIKRAEMVGEALRSQGVAAERIVLRSVGSGFPLARNVLNATPNPLGAQLNRRIEIGFVRAAEPLPFDFQVERPQVSELMLAPGAAQFDALDAGLCYRVEIATTRQILSSEALAMFGEKMIESAVGSGAYRYSAGLFKQYAQAAQLRRELQQQGFAEAGVVAFLNGIRISKAEAVGLLKKYPDLAGYVKG